MIQTFYSWITSHNGMLPASLKKEGNSVICDNVEELEGLSAN